jgi:two-component system, cell cycle sensor histidine kinase and response regulator CckA
MERSNRLGKMPMNEQKIRILLVEDQPGDARLIREALRCASEIELHTVDRLSLAVDHLTLQETDVVLLDLGLPDSRGLETLQVVYKTAPQVPIVVLTGQDDETIAIQAIRQGAQEYLTKSVMIGSMLARTLRFSFERKQAEKSLRESEARYRHLYESLMDGFAHVDMQGNIVDCNQTYQSMIGYERDELRSLTYMQLTPEKWHALEAKIVAEQILPHGYSEVYEKEYRRKNGEVFPVELRTSLLRDDEGIPVGMWAIVRDITERKRTEEALRKNETQFSNALKIARLGFWEYDVVRDLFTFSDHFYEIFRTTAEREGGYTMSSTRYYARFIHPEDRAAVIAEIQEVEKTSDPNYSRRIEHRIIYADGKVGYNAVRFMVEMDHHGRVAKTYGVNQDITEFKSLQSQFIQSQKMEGIGRLAGGIAHDFNNMLTIIVGYSEILLNNFSPDNPAREELEMIKDAGERAVALTSKILAFSRKQIVYPKVLDLNVVIKDTLKLLHRLVGEDIELITIPAPDLGSVKADMTQIEQAVFNLAINSRDAMPQGGKLIFETANIDLDASFVCHHNGSHQGRFVMLAVRDTGAGMDFETKSHIFEPFFTTKEAGKGTGLGLSTVYGFVKQSGGYITVDSEPGQGATIKIYFPRVDELIDQTQPFEAAGYEGSETILLVEDEGNVKKLATRWLKEKGYTVFAANDGPDALRIAEESNEKIDLLVTDIVMPKGLNGLDLADKLRSLRPGIKVLFISGYSTGCASNAVLNLNILPKPFTDESLTSKVRETLQQGKR